MKFLRLTSPLLGIYLMASFAIAADPVPEKDTHSLLASCPCSRSAMLIGKVVLGSPTFAPVRSIGYSLATFRHPTRPLVARCGDS